MDARTTRLVRLCISAVGLSSIQACECDRLDPPAEEVPCDFPASTISEPIDACDGVLVFGPRSYLREHGEPGEFRDSFAITRPGELCVRIVNGTDSKATRISSARVGLDDASLVEPNAFNKVTQQITLRRPVEPGMHEIDVRLVSTPDAFIMIEVRFAAAVTATEVAQADELAAIQQAACDKFNEHLHLMTPEETVAVREQLEILGVGAGQMRVRMNAYDVPRRLEPLAAEDVGQTASDSPADVALKWLDHHRDLFRWHDPRVAVSLDYTKSSRRSDGRVRLLETIDGLRVENAGIEVSVSGGQVTRFAGNFVPQAPSITRPAIDDRAASERAVQAEGPDAIVARPPTLAMFDTSLSTGRPGIALAWRVDLAVPPPALVASVWVDAEDGVILDRQVASLEAPQYEMSQGDALDHKVGTPDFFPEFLPRLYDNARRFNFGCLTSPEFDWCRRMVNAAGDLDLQWRVDHGRTGWSGDGVPPLPDDPSGLTRIPADDHYRIVMDPDGSRGVYYDTPGLEFFPPSYYEFPPRAPLAGDDRRPDGRIVFLNRVTSYAEPQPGAVGPSFDAIRHELGHGFHQAEVGNRGFGFQSRPPSWNYLTEHVAEYWAMNNTGDGEWWRGTDQDVPGKPARDMSVLECSSHFNDGGDCRFDEFVHLNYFVDNLRVPITKDFDWAHGNANIFDRLIFRVLDENPQVAHGVSSRGLGFRSGAFVFYELFTEHTTFGDDYLDYADNYRAAVSTLANKCEPPVVLGGAPTGGNVCRDDRSELRDGMDPLWALGFYSDPINLTALYPTEVKTLATPAAVNVRGVVDGVVRGVVRVFIATPSGLLQLGYDEPLAGRAPLIRNLTSDLPDTAGVDAFAVDTPDDPNKPDDPSVINLVYVTNAPSGPNLRVARITRGPIFSIVVDPTPALTARRALSQSPAITHTPDGQWRVVFVDERTMQLYEIVQGGNEPALVSSDADNVGMSPSLLTGSWGTLLLYRTPANKVAGRRHQISGVGVWGPQYLIEHLDDVGSAWTRRKQPTPSRAPQAAIVFPAASPRLQVFTNAPASGQVRQLSLDTPEPFSFRPYPESTAAHGAESRSVPMLDGDDTTGVAPVPFMHPILGEVLLVYYRGPPALGSPLMVAYKRSN